MKKPKLEYVKKYTRPAHYRINVSWSYLEHNIQKFLNEMKVSLRLNMDPDYQRGHIWTEDQQAAYVEFKLRDGQEANVILFNCPGWMGDWRGPFELVDGLQRVTAVRRFMGNEIKAFGYYLHEFEDGWTIERGMEPDFVFAINNLKTREEVLTWYLELNYQGTPHTDEELRRVKKLLDDEIKKKKEKRE